jgi:hypothetical protein
MDRLHRVFLLSVFVAVAAIVTAWPLNAFQRRPFYVSVTDSKGVPQETLTANDLAVEVNGKPASIVTVAPATEPVSIVVVTEGIRQDLISDIRKMMKAVVTGAAKIHADSRVGLMVEDGAAAPKMYSATADVSKLDTAIGRFFESSQNAPVLDGIMTAAQTLSFEKHQRRVIVVVTRGQVYEASDVRSPVLVSNAVRASGSSLWVLDLGGRDSPNGAAEQRVLADVTAASGGRQDRTNIASIVALTDRLMATLRGQFAVTIDEGAPAKGPAPKVTSRNKELKVLAPSWR